MIVNYEMNLLSLVRPWFDNNYQIQIKVLQYQILILNPNLKSIITSHHMVVRYGLEPQQGTCMARADPRPNDQTNLPNTSVRGVCRVSDSMTNGQCRRRRRQSTGLMRSLYEGFASDAGWAAMLPRRCTVHGTVISTTSRFIKDKRLCGCTCIYVNSNVWSGLQ